MIPPAVVAVAAMAIVGGCGGDDTSGASAAAQKGKASFDLTIGQLVPETGPVSAAADSTHKNAELAVARMQEALKATGADVTIKLVSADSQSEPQAAASAARKVIAEGADCIVGPLTSAETIAAAQSVTVPERIPMISPSATAVTITTLDDDGYVYRTSPSDTVTAQALAAAAAKVLDGADGKTLAIGGRNDDYGNGFVSDFVDAWTKLGGTADKPVIYDPSATSFDSEAGKLVSGDPAGFVIADFLDGYTKLGPALLRTGHYDLDHAFLGDALSSVSTSAEHVPPQIFNGATGVKASSPTTSAAYHTYKQYYETHPGVKNLGGYGPQVFDTTMLCALGAIAAGSSDPKDINEHLTAVSGPGGTAYGYPDLDKAVADLQAGKDIDFDGVSGPINWDKNGDVTGGTYDVVHYSNGEPAVTSSVAVGSAK
jgi:branched-chain amino acid transport system substrate-binding protein